MVDIAFGALIRFAPSSSIRLRISKHEVTKLTYALCKGDGCGKFTCTKCKMLVGDTESHVCEENGDYKQFRGLVRKSYRECPECRSAVELRDACNHIT